MTNMLSLDTVITRSHTGHKKSNLRAGQRKLAGSFVMTHS